jgi:hypothetical protein
MKARSQNIQSNCRQTARITVLAGLIVSMGVGAASAGYVVVDTLVDLDSLTIDHSGGFDYISQIFPGVQTIGDGDSVSVTFRFANDRALRIEDLPPDETYPEFLTDWLFLSSGTQGYFRITDIEFDLLGATSAGGAQTHFSLPAVQSGYVHLGPDINNPLLPGGSLTFTGIQATFNVDYVPGGANDYSPWLNIAAERIQVVDASVPDTASTAFLISLAMLGMASLNRRLR